MNEDALKAILEEFIFKLTGILNSLPKVQDNDTPVKGLSTRSLLEIISHESIVQEAYKDSKGIWTWGVGVTSKSGHSVERYIDQPQPLAKVISVFKWLLETKYLPDVLAAFKDFPLTEAQLAAATSFHWNTGAITKASWVKSFKEGRVALAKREFMQWRKPSSIIERREKERDLFFEGQWTNDGKSTILQVRKPSHTPDWGSAKRVDISKEL